MVRRRIDRFIEDALLKFSEWYVDADWLGKERDCVNLYALKFLASQIEEGAAVEHLSQIRIECAVAQPTDKGFGKKSATKDLVIWRGPEDTTWNSAWEPEYSPRAIMEWKTLRKSKLVLDFDAHDMKWLMGFTEQNPNTFGYLVQVCDSPQGRIVAWAKVARGVVAERRCYPK